jgi:O-acetylhomoserine/O-acetylserine sulfhydrylase-like pyridoxal-dependent enzyme
MLTGHNGFRAAILLNTRLVIGEAIGNLGLEVLDIPSIADIAHQAGIPLLVDSTRATGESVVGRQPRALSSAPKRVSAQISRRRAATLGSR